MVNDTISDMLTRLRNAYLANKDQTSLKATRVVKDIAQVLVHEGFLGPIEQEENGSFTVTLKRGVKQFERVSTPGVRVDTNHKDLQPVLNGMGVALIGQKNLNIMGLSIFTMMTFMIVNGKPISNLMYLQILKVEFMLQN